MRSRSRDRRGPPGHAVRDIVCGPTTDLSTLRRFTYARSKCSALTLTQPATIPAEALTGGAVTVQATGDMTIHGVTKSVTIPLQTQLNGSQIEVVGSLAFPMSDFGIDPPTIAGIVETTGRSEAEAMDALLQFNPQHRLIEPSEVTAAALWLCGPGSESINGQAIAIAGGEL